MGGDDPHATESRELLEKWAMTIFAHKQAGNQKFRERNPSALSV